MKHALILLLAAFAGCSTLQSPQGQAVLANANTIAKVAANVAATTYGVPAAGQLASAGLDALAQVTQSYVGYKMPANIVTASPGIGGLGEALAPLISSQVPVTPQDAATLWKAADAAKGM